jgi:uncharacterized membrane protein
MVTEYEETELVRPAPVLPGLLAAFPLALFTAALATDIAYAVTSDMIWADFSDWLLAGGLAIGILAFIAALVAAITHRRAPAARPTFPLLLGGLVVLVLAGFDNLVHSRDAWTSVVPAGLALTAITVLVMLLTAFAARPRAIAVESRIRAVRP